MFVHYFNYRPGMKMCKLGNHTRTEEQRLGLYRLVHCISGTELPIVLHQYRCKKKKNYMHENVNHNPPI